MSVKAAEQTPAQGGPETVKDLLKIVDNVAIWFQYIVLGIGTIMLIAAGLTWMTASGNEEKLVKARRMLIWGLVGIAVAIFAFVAFRFVKSFLGGQ